MYSTICQNTFLTNTHVIFSMDHRYNFQRRSYPKLIVYVGAVKFLRIDKN